MQNKIVGIALVVLCSLSISSCVNTPLSVSSPSHGLLSIDSTITGNADFKEYIEPFRSELDQQMNRVIGSNSENMLPKKPESNLSNFVADIIHNLATDYNTEHKQKSLPLLTLININGLRGPIPKGDVTVRDIFSVMPFENEIVILELSGDSVISLVNHIAKSNGDGVSNLKMTIKDDKVKSVKIADKSIIASENYYIATSDYIANGGDGYSMLLNPIAIVKTGEKVREAMISHIEMLTKKGQVIESEKLNRIQLL